MFAISSLLAFLTAELVVILVIFSSFNNIFCRKNDKSFNNSVCHYIGDGQDFLFALYPQIVKFQLSD